MSEESASALLNILDGSGSNDERQAIADLKEANVDFVGMLLDKYNTSSKWQVRASCVYYSIQMARDSKDALKLGIVALKDKSHKVRYRACMLLSYSLDKSALPYLKIELERYSEGNSRNDIQAAIEAIECQNSNYFVDRKRTGKIKFNIR